MAFLIIAISLDGRSSQVDDWKTIFVSDWRSGIDPRLSIQAPNEKSIEIEGSYPSSNSMLRFYLRRTDDFSRVANGSPRAEISFKRIFSIERNKDYQISWSIFFPGNFKFDRDQPEIFMQIHQGSNSGSPPIAILLDGQRYVMELRDSDKAVAQRFDLGNASNDLGSRVHWELRYRADHAGDRALTDLYKDGELVARCLRPCANAYLDDDNAYLKLGIYKWRWTDAPSDVTERTVFFGPVRVRERSANPKYD
ncbi:heparin lyase I family protein [Paraburkholderia sp. J94]|uniref:heparin lyase I family protein n=1 Tax=Paraburkholderia sp. J94 TaxID=2805441 RepID=UPI002AAF3C29|nr:heparin lyase I family protein [Paraburkholderia sp. J94]